MPKTLQKGGASQVLWIVTLVGLVAIVVILVLIMKRVLKSTLVISPAYAGTVSGNATAVIVPASSLADLANGNEFAYSFWMYSQSGMITAAHQFVLSHGPAGQGLNTVSLSPEGNQLIFSVAGQTATIPYLPMNRWVHIVAVYANGVVTFFMDGEVYSTQGLATEPVYSGSTGPMTISGGSNTGSTWSGFSGYVGKVSFLNFYPSPVQVRSLYSSGPNSTKGWLSIFGISGYGFRSPVYKMSTASTTCSNNSS